MRQSRVDELAGAARGRQVKVCLTGGIACGKSLAARYLREFGVETIDADDIVHELIPDPAERRRLAAEVFSDPAKRRALEAKIHPLVKAKIEEFLDSGSSRSSDSSLASGSSLCRPSRLSRRPPEGQPTPDGRQPTTDDRRRLDNSLIRQFANSLIPPLAIIPLLFETHWDREYDIICCVASERETQISRMTTTRGYSREEAEARLAAQMPVAEKAARSHYVIHNDGTPEELKEKVKDFLAWLASRN